MSVNSLVEPNEYTELDIDDILQDIDYEEEVNRRIQEQKDAVSSYFLVFNYILVLCLLNICGQSI